MYVHVYTQYVHVYAMYIHILTSCLNMMGRVPLIPLILAGNSTPTSPHQYSKHKWSEVWLPSGQLWHCSSGWQAWQQCEWGETVAVAVWAWQAAPGWSVDWKDWYQEEGCSEGAALAWSWDSPAGRRKADLAGWEMKCGCEPVQTGLYSVQTYICIYVYVCTMYIQLYGFINMYVLCTCIYRNSCTCMYIYVYLCTCIYHVQTCSQLYVN